jgi:hypothetical protein
MHGRLNILDIHRKINQKQEKKNVCYEKVLDICQKRIVTLAEREKTCCMFAFPEYIPGYPLFDLNTCMEYCKKSLVASGFWVDYYFPNQFYITWDFQEIKDKKNEAKKQIPLSALSSLAVIPTQSQSNSNNLQSAMPTIPYRQTSTPQIAQQPVVAQTMQSNTFTSTHNHFNTAQMQQNKQLQYMQNIPTELQQKMTTPLPLAPSKYDPYDVNIGIPSTQTNNMSPSSKPINNTFFPKNPIEYTSTLPTNQQPSNIKDMMSMLTSSIGNQHKNIFDYKPSGKLSLNI